MRYDPHLRRGTPLARVIKDRIRQTGPISISEYHDLCLNHPAHGYYRSKRAIGADADFITAPEISQVFGEIIGLWSAVTWQQMGSPQRFRLIELGPGRGSLIQDALRAATRVPHFRDAASVCLVEQNEALRNLQRQALSAIEPGASWFATIEDLGNSAGNEDKGGGPAIIIANEFLDVLPVDQFVRSESGWRARQVSVDEHGGLVFATGNAVDDHKLGGVGLLGLTIGQGDAPEQPGSILTVAPGLSDILREILRPWSPVGALFIDYGHEYANCGDTLQAMRNHAYEHPLTSPGDADLTALVDFARFRQSVSGSYAVDGPISQASFLGRLGAVERASRLMAANPSRASSIEAGVARLLAPNGMGSRFKAVAVRSLELPVLPGFEPVHGRSETQ